MVGCHSNSALTRRKKAIAAPATGMMDGAPGPLRRSISGLSNASSRASLASPAPASALSVFSTISTIGAGSTCGRGVWWPERARPEALRCSGCCWRLEASSLGSAGESVSWASAAASRDVAHRPASKASRAHNRSLRASHPCRRSASSTVASLSVGTRPLIHAASDSRADIATPPQHISSGHVTKGVTR
eukprot:scaffold13320_cov118-Isochrysis_galbana.AAC.9